MKVIAFAGRRVDAPDAETSRFAPADVPLVSKRIEQMLREERPQIVIASGAAGADLLCLQAAHRLGASILMVLPFDVNRFEQTSVADRPGDWPAIFRALLPFAKAEILTQPFTTDDAAYEAVTEALLSLALSFRPNGEIMAVVVWDGSSRGASDMTDRFLQRARALGLPVREISTRP